jgi:hypothetical protein
MSREPSDGALHHPLVPAWRHLRAIVLCPGMVTLVGPALVVWWTGAVDVGWGLPDGAAAAPVVLGVGLIALGLVLVVWTIRLFATVGQGTLAPWDPTSRLVVRGPYRHVRHPMISGVVLILLGEAALLGSLPLLLERDRLRGERCLPSPLRGARPATPFRGGVRPLLRECQALAAAAAAVGARPKACART